MPNKKKIPCQKSCHLFCDRLKKLIVKKNFIFSERGVWTFTFQLSMGSDDTLGTFVTIAGFNDCFRVSEFLKILVFVTKIGEKKKIFICFTLVREHPCIT